MAGLEAVLRLFQLGLGFNMIQCVEAVSWVVLAVVGECQLRTVRDDWDLLPALRKAVNLV